MNFMKWMDRVNDIIQGRSGVGVLDLPDFAYRDAYDAGESPSEVAEEVLEENGFDSDWGVE